MEGSVQICHMCGKENPVEASSCYACGAVFSVPLQPEGDFSMADETNPPEAPYPQAQPQAAPLPASPPQVFAPSQPPKRRRVRCCAIGCLLTLLVLLIGVPVLHVLVLRPILERAIYKQVQKNVAVEKGRYLGLHTVTVSERQLNADADDDDYWLYLPGASDGYLTLQQDQIRLEVKVYGVKVWAAADLRVNADGELVAKSIKMHWLLQVLFSEDGLKREITKLAAEKYIQPNGVKLLAFQVSEGKLFIAYEGR
jgi:hypothetical protein